MRKIRSNNSPGGLGYDFRGAEDGIEALCNEQMTTACAFLGQARFEWAPRGQGTTPEISETRAAIANVGITRGQRRGGMSNSMTDSAQTDQGRIRGGGY
jgi:hypothetical protein